MIKKKTHKKGIEIDLTGPGGNAYCLLGYAHNFCEQLDKDWNDIKKRMTSGNYENLIRTFEKEFGSFVTLLR